MTATITIDPADARDHDDAVYAEPDTDEKNPGGWIPEQKISVEETVRAFTWGSAFAEFQENWKGTLEPGKLADFVILSDDIFSIDAPKIRDVTVLRTIVDGKIVFEK